MRAAYARAAGVNLLLAIVSALSIGAGMRIALLVKVLCRVQEPTILPWRTNITYFASAAYGCVARRGSTRLIP